VRLLMVVVLVVMASSPLHAQGTAGRRGMGFRVGAWNVDVDPWITRSAQFEAFVQRDLGQDLALETSISAWRAVVNQTRAYIVPILTSVKYYPFTLPDQRVEPYLIGGLGFAFGIQDPDDNAIGGGTTTIASGIGFRAALGVEMRVVGGLGLGASGKYQWVHFGDEVGTMETFGGVGFEGAITYRFRSDLR
jgi:hypothetical protein